MSYQLLNTKLGNFPKSTLRTYNTFKCCFRQQKKNTYRLSISMYSQAIDYNDTIFTINRKNKFIDSDSVETELQRKIMSECSLLHSSIMPLNDLVQGPLARYSDRGTALPFVFLVGNHSSGKSSFVNYVLGRKVQTAGVAPTDDCFTVIVPGLEDSDQDGPALIGDPDIGFSQLRQFGPTLIHHTALKVRRHVKNKGFMMVDSPGMIDSPIKEDIITINNNGQMDRGYDFKGVIRWFAERADVVLLFFDPDKPGTTGETLNILLHSLGCMDHKLLIVLNKADQFKKIHDFARAYGSLCWNLSKVIPRKDLPRIFTMCLPVVESSEIHSVSGLSDLQQTRDDVVLEVMKAPKRRMDNVITHLHDSVHQLLMHIRITEDVCSRYSKVFWIFRMQEIGLFITGSSLVTMGIYNDFSFEIKSGITLVTVFGIALLKWINSFKLVKVEKQFLTDKELDLSFHRTHIREINHTDEFTLSMWKRNKGYLRSSLYNNGINRLSSVKKSDLKILRSILDQDIPRLRRLASPMHFDPKSNI